MDVRTQWKRQGNALGVSSDHTVRLWWPIRFLAPYWDRCLRVAGHELNHQVQSWLKDNGFPDPAADAGGHHADDHECLMVAKRDFWNARVNWDHSFVTRDTVKEFLRRGRITITHGVVINRA